MASSPNDELLTRPLEPRFIELLNKVISSLPKDDNITSSVRDRLETIWNKPRLEDISKCLKHENVLTLGEARELIFFPNNQSSKDYCELIKPPPEGATEGHPQIKVQIEFLTILYLLHVPHGSWTDFIQPFVLQGGLESLSTSFTHPNLYLRGQAVDAFLQITASQAFDWWEPLKLSSPCSFEIKKSLHCRMLELSKSKYFLPGLLLNSDSSKSWPGGPTQCLQLLASWLSWCRTLYTSNQSVRLSRTLLAAIQCWGDNQGTGTEDVDCGAALSPEMIEFRLKMYGDFNREPPIDGPEFRNGERCPMVEGILSPDSQPSEPVIELGDNGAFDLSDPVSSPPPPPPAQTPFKPVISRDFSLVNDKSKTIVTAKERGNLAFGEGRLDDALEAYEEALHDVNPGRDTAIIHCNRATVLQAMAKIQETNTLKDNFVIRSVEAARESVESDPTYSKGSYRLAQCLDASGNVKAALSALKTTVSNDKKSVKRNSRVPKGEQAEMAATEKLLLNLMEKLALEVESRDYDENNVSHNNVAQSSDKIIENQNKDLELEASILMKILRRKDAKTRHDYLAERSEAPESCSMKEELPENSVESEPTEEVNNSSALVPIDLNDREVELLAEETSEKLTRDMLELSKGEDSDDDDVVARVKSQRKRTQEKKKKTEVSNEGNANRNVRSDGEQPVFNVLGGEESKGKKVLKKISHSTVDKSSKLKDKKSKEKKEKRNQMDELRRIANTASAISFS